jgi:CelD/BcsL family acetyltransferase involved in cellulose biosynthesis
MRWATHGGGIFSADEVRRFHRRAVPLLYRSGALQLHVLRADERLIGVQYVLVHNSRALSYIGGFDPEFDRYSPGSLLMAYSIERAIDGQCSTFDLLRGTEAYKYTWGAVDHTSLSFARAGRTP